MPFDDWLEPPPDPPLRLPADDAAADLDLPALPEEPVLDPEEEELRADAAGDFFAVLVPPADLPLFPPPPPPLLAPCRLDPEPPPREELDDPEPLFLSLRFAAIAVSVHSGMLVHLPTADPRHPPRYEPGKVTHTF